LGDHILLLAEPANEACREIEVRRLRVELRGFGHDVCDVERVCLAEQGCSVKEDIAFAARDQS
jgi:hypothetical protein